MRFFVKKTFIFRLHFQKHHFETAVYCNDKDIKNCFTQFRTLQISDYFPVFSALSGVFDRKVILFFPINYGPMGMRNKERTAIDGQ